jgi:hypothetical protein
MEKAEARKLQPFYLRRFLIEALDEQGGTLKEREPDRYEVKHVPAAIRAYNKIHGNRRPVLEKYERITFDRLRTRTPIDKPPADLVHPAHPLMASLIELVLADKQASLLSGTVLVDPTDTSTAPRLMFLIDHGVREGTSMTTLASRRMGFVELNEAGVARDAGIAPYLSYRAPTADEAGVVAKALATPWLKQDLSQLAVTWATQHLVGEHLAEVQAAREKMATKTLEAVHARLTREITFWSKKRNDFDREMKAGKQPKMQPENAKKRVEDLKVRLASRTAELEATKQVASNPPVVAGCALVLPQGFIDGVRHTKSTPARRPRGAQGRRDDRHEGRDGSRGEAREHGEGRQRREVRLGRLVRDPPRMSTASSRVKGRIASADTVTVTTNEVLMGLNKGDRFILAVVLVNGDVVDGPHYIRSPFTTEPDVGAASVNYTLKSLKARARSRRTSRETTDA